MIKIVLPILHYILENLILYMITEYSVSKDKSIDILASPAWPVDDSETRKDIFFDHGYSSVSKDKDISVSPLPVENLLTVSESEKSDLSNKIDQQLTQLSKVGHSILFKNTTEGLSERNWFRDVLDEMNRKCPELLEVLLCAVGKCI